MYRDTLLRLLGRVTTALGGLALLVTLVDILYGVVTRYVVGQAPIWSDELARYCLIASALLIAGSVWVRGEHMRVALLERHLGHRSRRILLGYQWLLTLSLALAMTWWSWQYALSVSYFTSQGLGISRSIPMMAMPLGFGLLALQVLLHGPRALPRPGVDDAGPTEEAAS
ncbi:TRAP transporter small permease [Chromohalobacter israelensis]|uniref:TRAP transporter small permease protein n=1 Tax=Chromohalobacter israelensis (strain ATCC BAA-138 / DSM 3043 / CIP 106854 / NCIMB 13768 / 1H11) TaxID=290398 RepID=Q1QZT6_CHRI1|nr:TRAP transporter small permease [Chromohalobacter salexigens]ABE58022.1 Tripartite ATP-independent periplasmic transporter, DctQ component [Chromohalobacter salexigens DSM 3043]NWO56111.1 TRAP transporter small permease [Chromohalobacter salexigens]